MSDILAELGLDEEDIQWYQLAACKNMDVNWFYDRYESDQELAQQVDQVCLHCPVSKQCLEEGVNNKERGVWGGIYLDLGRIDKTFNRHKSSDTWKQLRKVHGKRAVY